ncbi:MAG: group III truncated hemoglobin [Microthrixaceae bacterium]
MSDLDSRGAIHDLVVEFYREVVLDEVLEPVFGDVAEVDWAEHIPKLVDYWCHVLLRSEAYAGSIVPAHRELHALQPLGIEHCDRWYFLWVRSVDSSWSGPVAERAKGHAASVMRGLAPGLRGHVDRRGAIV